MKPPRALLVGLAALAVALPGAAIAASVPGTTSPPIVQIQGTPGSRSPDASVTLRGITTARYGGNPHYFVQAYQIICFNHATSVSFTVMHTRRVLKCATRLAMLSGYLSPGATVAIKVRAMRARSGHILKRGPLRSATMVLPKPYVPTPNVPTVSTPAAPSN